MATDVTVREMTELDVESAISVFAESIGPLAHEPGLEQLLLERLADAGTGYGARFRASLRRFCESDPDGAWIADVDGVPAGFVISARREDLWTLPMLFVTPAFQSHGLGRTLLARALDASGAATRGLIMSSTDPRAIRAYSGAGFDLHPTVMATGRIKTVDAPSSAVRHGSRADLALVDRVDVTVRGSSRLADIGFLVDHGARLLILDEAEPGYVVHFDGMPIMDGNPLLLASESPDGARRLLTTALGEIGPVVQIYGLTAQQPWAIETALAAGLEIVPGSPVFVRGAALPPAAWIPSGIWF